MTKVLVVDDDVEAAETLALLLSLSGHEVHVAHNGRQALGARQGTCRLNHAAIG